MKCRCKKSLYNRWHELYCIPSFCAVPFLRALMWWWRHRHQPPVDALPALCRRDESLVINDDTQQQLGILGSPPRKSPGPYIWTTGMKKSNRLWLSSTWYLANNSGRGPPIYTYDYIGLCVCVCISRTNYLNRDFSLGCYWHTYILAWVNRPVKCKSERVATAVTVRDLRHFVCVGV